jgi:hypothetical protein
MFCREQPKDALTELFQSALARQNGGELVRLWRMRRDCWEELRFVLVAFGGL